MSEEFLTRKEYINQAMTINESKAGELYIKVNDRLTSPFILYPGEALFLKNNQDGLDESLDAGRIDEVKHKELSDKLSFIKYQVTVPPYTES